MNASRTPTIIAPITRPASACALWSLPLRSSQGLSGTNTSAAFWPWPEKEKPITPMVSATSGCLCRKFSTAATAASVRLEVAPGGSCTLTIR